MESGDSKNAPLTFGISKTSKQKKVSVQIQDQGEKRQLIASIGEDGRIQPLEPEHEQSKQLYVIPSLANTYAGPGGRRFAPSFRPPANDAPVVGASEDRFELAEKSATVLVEYGLERRQRPEAQAANDQQQPTTATVALLEQQAYQRDMAALPDTAPVEAYESMPIEEFGKAMLRGMGWEEGMGVGRNRRQVEPTEYLRRPERLGLGAKPAAPTQDSNKPKVVKMGDKPRANPSDMVLPPDADGRQRHVRSLDEALVSRAQLEPGPRPGKTMRVIDGRHEGLMCTVLELLPTEPGRSSRASVRLLPSHEVVQVRVKELADVQRQGQQAQEAKRKDSEPPSKRARTGASQRRDNSDDEEQAQQKDMAPPAMSWLAPHIKVRIVDKRARKGRLYLKKGVVVDVHPGALCDVSVDETQEVVQLPQSALETVIPREEGAIVMVVLGKLRGHQARLLKARTSRMEGVAAVQLLTDLSIHRLLLDEVASYVGPVDDDL